MNFNVGKCTVVHFGTHNEILITWWQTSNWLKWTSKEFWIGWAKWNLATRKAIEHLTIIPKIPTTSSGTSCFRYKLYSPCLTWNLRYNFVPLTLEKLLRDGTCPAPGITIYSGMEKYDIPATTNLNWYNLKEDDLEVNRWNSFTSARPDRDYNLMNINMLLKLFEHQLLIASFHSRYPQLGTVCRMNWLIVITWTPLQAASTSTGKQIPLY